MDDTRSDTESSHGCGSRDAPGRVPRSCGESGKRDASRFLRLTLVALLVASVFAVGATGTVAASDPGLECDVEIPSPFSEGVFTLGECTYQEPSYDGQTSASFAIQNLDDRIQADYSRLNNSYEATRTMAYRIAESEFSKEMANGSSKTEPQAHADKEVREFVADTWENKFARRSNSYASVVVQATSLSGISIGSFASYSGASYSNRTIFAGTSQERTVNLTEIPYGSSTPGRNWAYSGTTDSFTVTFSADSVDNVPVSPKMDDFVSLGDKYLSIYDEVSGEISTFSQNVSESEYDNLSASDIPSPITQATEFGQEWNDTGSSGYASALSASLGLSVDVGTTYHVELLDTGTHYNGTLYAEESQFPNNTIETETVYDGANQSVWLATTSGESFDIDTDYKVHGIELRDGNATNSTALSDYSRTSLNASAPIENLNDWMDLRQKAGTSGAAGGGLLGGNSLFILLALAGAALFLYAREQDDGNGGGGTTIEMS
jgi:hypothetical protein